MANRTVKKNAARDVDSFISSIGRITLDEVYDQTDKKSGKVRQLNLPNLIKEMVKSIMRLSGTDPAGNNVRYSAADKALIETFLTDFNNTVEYFMDFLDYDNDNQINLVKFEKNTGNIDVGKDLQEFINDVKGIGSSFKTNASAGDKVFSTLSNIFMYMLSDRYSETKEDIINFNASVKETYASLKALKDINHNKVFDSRVDDIVSFIITFCVVLVPVIELVNNKLAELNKNDLNSKSEKHKQIVIKNRDIVNSVELYYGDKLESILNMIEEMTKQMSKVVESSKWQRFKEKVCCCCVSTQKTE